MNRALIIILVVIILIGGFFLLRSNSPVVYDNSNASSNIPATNTAAVSSSPKVNGVPVSAGAKMETGTINTSPAEKITVTYSDSGFSPDTVTIRKGGTVTFINRSSGSMWVASNPHPVHTDYPAFDEKASVSSGGSWSFTFSQPGSWGYHNHKSPSNTGTVVVE